MRFKMNFEVHFETHSCQKLGTISNKIVNQPELKLNIVVIYVKQ